MDVMDWSALFNCFIYFIKILQSMSVQLQQYYSLYFGLNSIILHFWLERKSRITEYPQAILYHSVWTYQLKSMYSLQSINADVNAWCE